MDKYIGRFGYIYEEQAAPGAIKVTNNSGKVSYFYMDDIENWKRAKELEVLVPKLTEELKQLTSNVAGKTNPPIERKL